MMMNPQEQPGFLSLGGYGSGLAHGFQQAYSSVFNTWQMPGADHEGGLVDDNVSHCFDWPELDISNSMPAINGKEANSSNPCLNSPAF